MTNDHKLLISIFQIGKAKCQNGKQDTKKEITVLVRSEQGRDADFIRLISGLGNMWNIYAGHLRSIESDDTT